MNVNYRTQPLGDSKSTSLQDEQTWGFFSQLPTSEFLLCF